MIDLTPIDIRKKQGDFPRAMRGYATGEVEDFLGLCADRLEEVMAELLRLQTQVAQQEQELRQHREREQALTGALVSAQELRDEVLRQANKEAELIRKEGEVEAERLRAAVLRAVQEEEHLIQRLRARRTQMLRSYRSFLERELGELAVLEATVAEPGETLARSTPPRPAPPAAETLAPARAVEADAEEPPPPLDWLRHPDEDAL